MKTDRSLHDAAKGGFYKKNWGILFYMQEYAVQSIVVNDVSKINKIRFLYREMDDREWLEDGKTITSFREIIEQVSHGVVSKAQVSTKAEIEAQQEAERNRPMSDLPRRQPLIPMDSSRQQLKVSIDKRWHKGHRRRLSQKAERNWWLVNVMSFGRPNRHHNDLLSTESSPWKTWPRDKKQRIT